jgi:hypothetical protein
MERPEGQPIMTITVATNDGWEATRDAYEAVRKQTEGRDIDIILIDGSGATPPDASELSDRTRVIQMSGADIGEMRMRGYREATGGIVGMIEDHVVVGADWVDNMIKAHEEHPEAIAVGGGVKNGTPYHLIDWASFYAGHAPYIFPLPTGEAEFLDGAYVSYKREPLQRILDGLGDRAIETLINEEIRARGGELWSDDRLYVSHIQSRGFAPTLRLHFYAGQHFEGTRRAGRSDGTKRLVRAAMLPLPRVARRLATARQRGEPMGRLVRVAPAMLLVFSSQAAGEMTGIVNGPGRSAAKIH